MAVDEQVDAGHGLDDVKGLMADRFGVHAQVAQAHDVFRAGGLEGLDLRGGGGDDFGIRTEGDALDHVSFGYAAPFLLLLQEKPCRP